MNKHCESVILFCLKKNVDMFILQNTAGLSVSKLMISVNKHRNPLTPFPDDKNLTLSKLKAFADDKINVT